MNIEAMVGLINNAALLLAVAVLHDILRHAPQANTRAAQILTGLALGLIGAGMGMIITPWQFAPGVIFNARSILFSVAGLFFGVIPTLMAALSTDLFLLYQEGTGAWPIAAAIITAAGVGLAWRQLRPKWFGNGPAWLELYGFGLVTQLVTLGWLLLLPGAMPALNIGLPVIIIYPLATVLLGLLLERQNIRREADQKMQAGYAQYRRIIETAEEGIWQLDTTNKTVLANPKLGRLLGYTPAEMMGASVFNFIGANDIPLAHAYLAQLRQGERPQPDFRFQHKDGHTVWTRLSTNPVWDDAGQYAGVMAIVTDITRRKQAEEERDRFFNLSMDMLCVAGFDGYFRQINPAWTATLGWDSAELLSTPWLDFVHPADKTATEQSGGLLTGGQPLQILENRYRCKDGSYRWLAWKAFPNQETQTIFAVARDITDRKQTDDALRKSEERFRVAFHTNPDTFSISRVEDGLFIDVNEGFTAMLGYTSEETIGRTALEMNIWVEPQDRVKLVAGLKENGYVNNLETIFRAKNGNLITSLISARIIQLDDVPHLLATAKDINAMKQVERALRESEEKYRSLFSNMSEGVALHEMIYNDQQQPVDYVILDVNPQFEAILGITARQAIGQRGTVLYSAEPSPYMDTYAQVAATGEPAQFETYFAPLNKYFDISVVSPGANRFATIFNDITERKLAKEALEKRILALTNPLENTADIKFEDLFNLQEIQTIQDAFAMATGVASIITDAEGRPITQPSNFCHLCQNIIRKTEKGLANCYHSDAVLGCNNPNGPTMQPCLSGGLWDGGASIRAGNHHIANWLIGQVLDDSINQEAMLAYAAEIGADKDDFKRALNNVTRMPKEQFANVCNALFLIAEQLSRLALQNIQQARYITERAQTEESLRRLNDELEQRVAERTAQLEARNHELETFTYSVSHDLKAPLRGIDGYSRLLLEDYADKLDEEGRGFLHTVRKATMQMGQLIEDLLAYSRLERRPLQPGQLNPRLLVETLLAERDPEIQTRNVAVSMDVPNLAVLADPDGLAMALRNLLDNALKFTKNTTQPILIIGGRETETSCIIWVQDNGVGFDMKFHNRIFDIFQRLHRAEDYPGTGIGLALVYKAMQRMNGRAWATSEVGQGATFYLEIPRQG